jgi:hypothetical protein
MDACGIIWNIYVAEKPIVFTQTEFGILSAMNDILAQDRTANVTNALEAFNSMLCNKTDAGEFDFADFIRNRCVHISIAIEEKRTNEAYEITCIMITSLTPSENETAGYRPLIS